MSCPPCLLCIGLGFGNRCSWFRQAQQQDQAKQVLDSEEQILVIRGRSENDLHVRSSKARRYREFERRVKVDTQNAVKSH